MQKVSFPLPSIVEFYYYYSTAILALCWMIAPFLFYVILTKSKKLNSIKWLIFNHSFWCLVLETMLGLVKPLFLLPCAGGIQIGFFKNMGNFRNTAFAAFICFCLISNCIYSLLATISSRYMFVFPSKLMLLKNVKANFIGAFAFAFASYAMLFVAFWPALKVNEGQIREWAFEYDPYLPEVLHIPSFFMFPPDNIRFIMMANIGLYVVIITGTSAFSVYFIRTILQRKTSVASTAATTRLHRSLILSSVMQIHLTNIFLLIPFLMFYVFIAFEVPHSATIYCVFTCIFMTHCLVEFLATFYFISPYRTYISTMFKKKISYQKQSNNSRQSSVLIS